MGTRTLERRFASTADEERAHQRNLRQREATRRKITPADQLPRESEAFYQKVIGKIPFDFNTARLGDGETSVHLNHAVPQDVFDAVVNQFRTNGWTVTYVLDFEDAMEGIRVKDILTLTPPANWLDRLLPSN